MNKQYRVLRYLSAHNDVCSDVLKEKFGVSEMYLDQLHQLGYISRDYERTVEDTVNGLTIIGASYLADHRQSQLILVVSIASALSSLAALVLAIL